MTILVLSCAGFLFWWVLRPLVRFAAKLLTVIAVASATAVACALLLGQSPEGQIGWALVGFFAASIFSVRMVRRNESLRLESWTEQPRKLASPAEVSASTSADHVTASGDSNQRLRLFDRLGLTKAGRRRRDAAVLAEVRATAWTELAEEAEFASNRIAVARRSCDRFTKQTSSTPFDVEALAHLIVLQKRVPEMIGRRLSLCAAAGAAERRRLLEDLIDQLEQIAAEGERRLSRRGPGPLQELDVEKAYLQGHFARTDTSGA